MATMNFSIPDNIKERFNRAFANENKSAIVTALLEEAIERAERKAQRNEAIERILLRLNQRSPVSQEEIEAARDKGRP